MIRGLWLFLFSFIFLHSTESIALTCDDNVAQAPSEVEDPYLGRWIAEKVEEEVLTKEKLNCPVFVDFDETMQFFDYIGLNFYFKRTPQSLGPRQINLIRQKTKASHILFVDAEHESLNVHARLYRMMGEDDSVKLVLERNYLFDLNFTEAEKNRAPAYLDYMAILTPNALATGFTSTEMTLELNEDYKLISSEQKSFVPSFLSSISFDKIEHSAAYNQWAASGHIFPGLFLTAIDQYTSIYRKPEKEDDPKADEEAQNKPIKLHMQLYGACSNFNAMGTLHTPIGAPYLSLGWGPCLIWEKHDDEAGKVHVNAAGRFVAGHRFFVTNRFFIYFEADLLFFSENLYSSDYGKVNQVQRGTIGFGNYIPDVESKFIKTARYLGF